MNLKISGTILLLCCVFQHRDENRTVENRGLIIVPSPFRITWVKNTEMYAETVKIVVVGLVTIPAIFLFPDHTIIANSFPDQPFCCRVAWRWHPNYAWHRFNGWLLIINGDASIILHETLTLVYRKAFLFVYGRDGFVPPFHLTLL